MTEINEEELDEFINDELEKDITQEDTIDKELVDQQIGSMGFLYEFVNQKLHNDKICFGCKRAVDTEKEKLNVVPTNKTDKGAVAFVGLCEECHDKLLEESKQIAEKVEEVKKTATKIGEK